MSGILVGVDGSAHSARALEWAAREAATRGVALTVLTVHQVPRGFYGGSVSYPQDESPAEHARQLAQEQTDKVLAELAAKPPSVAVEGVSGIPAEELLRAAAGADMIVIGSRGAGGFAQLLLGSVSAQVSHHAHCPVVIVPPEDRA